MCFDYEIPEKKNKFALDDEELEQVEPELEQVQEEQPVVTSIISHL